MRNLPLSLINVLTGRYYLRIYGNLVAKVTIVLSLPCSLFQVVRFRYLSVNGQTYFPSNTIQQSTNAFRRFLPYLGIQFHHGSLLCLQFLAGQGVFSFTIEGLPEEGVKVPINDEKLMALQIELDKDNRGLFFTSSDDVSGKIFVGKNNIETNQGDDFDVKNLFNNCRTLAFSSTGDVKIKTPLPATPASDRVETVILPTPFTGNSINPLQSNNFICPVGYYRNSFGYCVPLLQ